MDPIATHKAALPFRIKVCGMRDVANIQAVSALKPDYMGFIFYERSKRFVGEDFVMPEIDPFIRKVGVFVNASMDYVLDKVGRYALDFVQLHGDEDAAYCEELRRKVKVIKAFGVDERFDFHSLSGYLGKCDYFLFDTKVPEYGGSGRSFNWEVLNFYPYDQPFFLSGGIGLEEVKKLEVIQIRHLYAIDVNSRFETAPGKKDIQQVSQLISYKNELSR